MVKTLPNTLRAWRSLIRVAEIARAPVWLNLLCLVSNTAEGRLSPSGKIVLALLQVVECSQHVHFYSV